MRLLIYVDSVYRRRDGAVYGDLSFTRFIAELSGAMEVTVIGRLDPEPGPARYRLPDEVRFIALPHYASLAAPGAALASLGRSLALCWAALADTDTMWLFGPYLHAQLFAVLGLLRRRRVVLGVRQNFPDYVRARRPDRVWMHHAADALESSWRRLARRLPTVVVGEALAGHYRASRRLLTIVVSLISAADIAAGAGARGRSYDDGLQLLSVGRLDAEKNPLLLADVLARLRAQDPRWRLVVCGDGPLQGPLARRLDEAGVAHAAELRGHVTDGEGLMELYRSSHIFLHVSHTEGFPQVLVEAFASGLPSVATAVGGVAAAARDAALLVGPDDADAAASAASRLADEPALRERLIDRGLDRARELTMERQIARVAAFLQDA